MGIASADMLILAGFEVGYEKIKEKVGTERDRTSAGGPYSHG
jgi:hypothetical protein